MARMTAPCIVATRVRNSQWRMWFEVAAFSEGRQDWILSGGAIDYTAKMKITVATALVLGFEWWYRSEESVEEEDEVSLLELMRWVHAQAEDWPCLTELIMVVETTVTSQVQHDALRAGSCRTTKLVFQ
mmetsp:Transcript_59533/g.164049  ORF Transcript_59533/g.164049 Transcript_59533/m.164049 type:complete len:129 (+) Transcript_59533:281-667(+)